MGNPENLLKGKTAIEKLGLTLQFIPMFSLTAFFRVGSGVPKVRSYKCRRHNHRCYCLLQVMGPYSNSITPFSPAFYFFIVWIWYKMHVSHTHLSLTLFFDKRCLLDFLMLFLIALGLKRFFEPLRQLSMMEVRRH